MSSVAGRLTRLRQNIAALVRLRLLQARREANDTVRSVLISLVMILVAFVLTLFAIPLLLTALILALAQVMPAWLAAAIVLIAALIIAAAFLWSAQRRIRRKRIRVLDDLRADWQAIRRRLEEGS